MDSRDDKIKILEATIRDLTQVIAKKDKEAREISALIQRVRNQAVSLSAAVQKHVQREAILEEELKGQSMVINSFVTGDFDRACETFSKLQTKLSEIEALNRMFNLPTKE